MPAVKLNLGAGNTEIAGYAPIDIADGKRAYPLDYPDASVDEIRASHLLEHFSHKQTVQVLREWSRALKPGGILKVAVPNMDTIIRQYEDGTDPLTEMYLMGGHTDNHDVHLAVFNEEKLRAALEAAGFCDITTWKSEIQDCAALPVSLNLMGRKGKVVVAPNLKIAAAMSVPRLGFMDNFFCVFEGLTPLKIPLRKITGAFWGQVLEKCLMDLIDEYKPDALLTIDYDTLFTIQDVVTLATLMQNHPEADAIAPLQSARAWDTPLVVVHDENGKATAKVLRTTFDADLCRIASAHFGLTLLRTSSLLEMPHPWFHAEPAADGTWGEGHVDADVHFWRQWHAKGKTLYLANRVAVGHAELMVTWPGAEDMHAVFQRMADYREHGKPETAWK